MGATTLWQDVQELIPALAHDLLTTLPAWVDVDKIWLPTGADRWPWSWGRPQLSHLDRAEPVRRRLAPVQELIRHPLERWLGTLRTRFKPKTRLAGDLG